MIVQFEYEPISVHAAFHASNAYERAMFGAMGSGKTYAICSEAIAWCLEQPGISGIITRKTIPELRDSTETVFFELLPPELYKAGTVSRAGGHYERFIFPNGSEVLFRSIDDWKKYKSYNLGFIAWDEADEFDLETYTGMKARLRQKFPTKRARELGYKNQITRRGTWVATNPEGHNWLWERFIRDKIGEYFQSTSFDNPYNPPDYYANLLTMPEAWVKRYVMCQFDDFAGQIYADWGEHCIVDRYQRDAWGEIQYPNHAQFWMGFDPGTENPSAGLWVVLERTPKVRMVGIAEYCQGDRAATQHANAWRRIEAQHQLRVRRRIADPNKIGIRDTGSNNRLDDIYRRLGFNFEKGPSRYDDRIPVLQDMIHNGQFVLTPDCPMTYESILQSRWKDLTPAQRATGEEKREVPLKKERDLCDTAEYLAGRYVRPIAGPTPIPEHLPEWQHEAWQHVRRTLQRNAKMPTRQPALP